MKVLDKREDNERLWVESWWFFLRLGHIIHLICVSQNRLTLWSRPLQLCFSKSLVRFVRFVRNDKILL